MVPEFATGTGDPTGTGRGGSGSTIAAELSEQPFRRGGIGMKHDRRGPDTADSQNFILHGDAAHLDWRYTYWGEAIHGMRHLERLRRGSPPRDPDRIVRLRVLGDHAR